MLAHHTVVLIAALAALRDMAEADLRALYRFIVHLGPDSTPTPAYVPPTQEPKPPYVTFPAPPK